MAKLIATCFATGFLPWFCLIAFFIRSYRNSCAQPAKTPICHNCTKDLVALGAPKSPFSSPFGSGLVVAGVVVMLLLLDVLLVVVIDGGNVFSCQCCR